MMHEEIIWPKKEKNDPNIGPVTIIVAMEKDLVLLRRSIGIQGRGVCSILSSRLYKLTGLQQEITLVGPVLGAPYAVMVLEKLIVLGAQTILFFGWCGSIQQSIRIADLVIPDGAVVGEGTSGYYPLSNGALRPSDRIKGAIEKSCKKHAIPFHKGSIWSTDAPYRETKQNILLLQRDGVLGVDMELSALFTVARFRQVEIGALLVVSDELASLRWRPGFSSSKFNRSRRLAIEVVTETCVGLNMR